MGEKIIIVLLVICMFGGIAGGPYLWSLSAVRQEKKTEAPEEKNTEISNENADEEINDAMIRVLLSNSALGSYEHKKVMITSEKDYYVQTEKKTEKKKAGTVTSLQFEKNKKGQTVVFSGTGKLKLLSVKRAYGTPSYRGILKVTYENGALSVINQLLLEEYLYAVIPSEMPISYGEEALKVQAVCARSFAVKQKQGKKFQKYGADVDDSVASQVYNNTKECEESIRAAMETAGEVLTYQKKVISAYFFSTSWGHTADSNDVWIKPGSSPSYLRGKLQNETEQELNLSSEQELKEFLNTEEETYDSESAWYRWTVSLPISSLNRENIGNIRNIRVTKRGKSGVAKELRITGSGGVRVIQGEYQIRSYLSPNGKSIDRKDGTKAAASILPSGCFYIEEKGNNILIHGGGYGHGVGMSQNGVKQQAKEGKTYDDILKFYYTGTEIKDMNECE